MGSTRGPVLALLLAAPPAAPGDQHRRRPHQPSGILEAEIARVPRGRALVLPAGDRTRGHGSHTLAPLWKERLAELLRSPAR